MRNYFVFVFFLSFSTSGISQNLDIEILRDIHVNRNKGLDPAYTFITNSVSPLSFAIPVGVITYAILKKDKGSRDDAVLISSSILVSGIISISLKHVVDRDRPFETYPFIDNPSSDYTPSFPSGHTTHAFSLATSVSIAYPQWYVIAPSFVWAAAVGYSRMHFGYHYPSDVLTGAFIGSGSSFLCHIINQKIQTKAEKLQLSSSLSSYGFMQLTLTIPLEY